MYTMCVIAQWFLYFINLMQIIENKSFVWAMIYNSFVLSSVNWVQATIFTISMLMNTRVTKLKIKRKGSKGHTDFLLANNNVFQGEFLRSIFSHCFPFHIMWPPSFVQQCFWWIYCWFHNDLKKTVRFNIRIDMNFPSFLLIHSRINYDLCY